MCYVAMEAYLSLYPNPIFRVEESPFTDADDPVITKAYYLGLISGFPDGTFRPDTPITREQFFKITVNFLSVCGYPYEDSPSTSLDHFTDAGELSSYALPCARLLVELGIVRGDGKQLLPKSSTQCQQALAMFFRSYLTLQAWMEDSVDPDGRPEADALVEFALQYVGYNYIWGGKDPSTGFDCSGFVWYVYTHNGYEDIGRTATDQWYYENSQEVSQDSLLPGDLLFFSETDSLDNITHVGIYIGGGEFVHAANSRDGVIVTAVDAPYYGEHYIGARRIIPA
jgi:NLP/P60 protein